MITTIIGLFIASLLYERYCDKMLFDKVDLHILSARDWNIMTRPYGVIIIWHKYKHYGRK